MLWYEFPFCEILSTSNWFPVAPLPLRELAPCLMHLMPACWTPNVAIPWAARCKIWAYIPYALSGRYRSYADMNIYDASAPTPAVLQNFQLPPLLAAQEMVARASAAAIAML